MSETASMLHPLLKRYPDARLGKAPLIDPILFPYLGLMLGFAAALAGAYNAWMLRRFNLLLRTIVLGMIGCGLFFSSLVLAATFGLQKMALAVIVGRAMHFAIGGLLYFMHRPHAHGHTFQGGATASVLRSYLLAIVLSISIPSAITWYLLGGMIARR